MGTKTEIINLLADMPDEAQKETLKFVKKISHKYQQKTLEDAKGIKKFIKLSSQNKKYGFKGLNRQELYND